MQMVRGVIQDKKRAKEYFGKACDGGDQKGCDNYKILNQQGIKKLFFFNLFPI
ncbi:hypothetical protein MASR2M54_19680 [Aliarcobacter cryaerophilus]